MNKTKVDDMIIEMIEPKLKEIEKKFGEGKGLTQEDINTLLLKSQYNHINHLDLKLNEVVSDVASLKGEFQGLKGEFQGLKGEFELLKVDISNKVDSLEKTLKLEISNAINTNMRWSIGLIAFIVTALKLADMFLK